MKTTIQHTSDQQLHREHEVSLVHVELLSAFAEIGLRMRTDSGIAFNFAALRSWQHSIALGGRIDCRQRRARTGPMTLLFAATRGIAIFSHHQPTNLNVATHP
jgi:hypothetical protein